MFGGVWGCLKVFGGVWGCLRVFGVKCFFWIFGVFE